MLETHKQGEMSRKKSVKADGERYIDTIKSGKAGHKCLRDQNSKNMLYKDKVEGR